MKALNFLICLSAAALIALKLGFDFHYDGDIPKPLMPVGTKATARLYGKTYEGEIFSVYCPRGFKHCRHTARLKTPEGDVYLFNVFPKADSVATRTER